MTSKKFSLTLVLICLVPIAAGAQCRPWEVQLSDDTLKGCGSDWALYKMRNLRIDFPDGFQQPRTPEGHGSCYQATSCDALTGLVAVLEGKTECWPLFDTPVSGEGIWEQTVHNQLAVPKLRQCSTNFYAGPVECVEHPTALSQTTSVVHSCPPAGGIVVTVPPIVLDTPCWIWTFFPGMPPCDPFWWPR